MSRCLACDRHEPHPPECLATGGMFRNAWEEGDHPRDEGGQFKSRFDGAVDSLKADAERLGISWSGRRPQYRKGSRKALVANEITCYRAQGMLSLERLGMTKDEARALAASGEVKLLAGRHVKDDPTVILPKGKLSKDGGGPGGAEGSMTGMFRNAELSLHEDRHGSTEHHHRKRGPDQSRGFYDLTPGDRQRLVYGNTVADVRMMPNGTVILGSIYREKPGAPGEASELLRKLVSRADQAGTPMRLLAAPMTAGRAGHRMTVEDLVAWYGRFGFVQDPKQSAEEYARRMTRAPRPSKLKKDGGGPGGAEGSMTGADVHTDVGGRTGKRSRTQGTITLRDNSR